MTPCTGRCRSLAAIALVIVLAGAGLAWWLPSDATLAQRAGAAATEKLGVTVTVGALHWQLIPEPSVTLENVRTEQKQPVLIDRLTATPRVGSLLRGPVEWKRLDVDGATVPQLSLTGLGGDNESQASALDPASGALPLAHLQIRDLRWISRTGITVVYDGEADFDPAWRPRSAQLRRAAYEPATSLTLQRQGDADRWRTEIRVGGGTGDGEVALKTDPDGLLHLSGELVPKQIEVRSALAAFNRSSPVSGSASGHTTLAAQGRHVGELARSLHTHTAFNMAPATLVRFDLDRAIRTLGKAHAGTTRLDTLTGLLDTQNTPDGMVSRFTELKARSGTLSASGDATLAQRQIDAHAAVDLVDGVLGVPLRIKGPVNAPEVSVPGGAVAGAAVGTVVLPGIGTAIGARIGATLGKLFGREAPPPVPKKPQAKTPR